MMKKKVLLSAVLVFVLAFTGCGSESGKRNNKTTVTVDDVLQNGMKEADESSASETSESETAVSETSTASGSESTGDGDGNASSGGGEEVVVNTEDVDVDLTVLSSTMVYTEVYNMMTTPENYIGKTIKMDGAFSMFHDEQTDKYYFACIISDATACCSQGIEFELTDEYSYPADYPEIGEEICVTGTFDTYREGEYEYCTLRNAKKCAM